MLLARRVKNAPNEHSSMRPPSKVRVRRSEMSDIPSDSREVTSRERERADALRCWTRASERARWASACSRDDGH